MSTCIFCLEPTSEEPVEHILPESLVGHRKFKAQIEGPLHAEIDDYLVLDADEVCSSCNTERLNRLDEYLQEQLGFLKVVWNDIGTKRGKPAKVERPGLFARREEGQPRVILNDEDEAITTDDGIVVRPADDSPRTVEMKDLEIKGRRASFKMSQRMRLNKRVVRALHKIAFEALCHRKGAEFVLDEAFDPVREYVLHGRGSRQIVFTTEMAKDTWITPTIQLRRVTQVPGWIAVVGLGANFHLDLTPNNSIITRADPDDLRGHGMVRWSDRGGGTQVQSET